MIGPMLKLYKISLTSLFSLSLTLPNKLAWVHNIARAYIVN
jgi:hypothetical protein